MGRALNEILKSLSRIEELLEALLAVATSNVEPAQDDDEILYDMDGNPVGRERDPGGEL